MSGGDRSVPSNHAILSNVLSARTGVGRRSPQARAPIRVWRTGSVGRPGGHLLHRRLICLSALHTNKEMVLVLNEEDDDALVQAVLLRGHCMRGVRQHAGLENGRQILRVHAVLIGFGSKNGQQIQNVKKQLFVKRGQFGNYLLVFDNGSSLVKVFNELRTICIADCLLCSPSKGVAEFLVQVQRHYRLGQVVEISSEYRGGIVDGVSVPDEPLAISIRRIEYRLELLDSFLGPIQSKDAFNTGSWYGVLVAE